MFSERRAEEADRLVQAAPLLKLPANSRVLDLCCGPGLFMVPLARRGHRVTGVDLSPLMLKRATVACERAGVQARLVRADMLTFAEPESFDAVLNVTSFGYFDSAADNVQVRELLARQPGMHGDPVRHLHDQRGCTGLVLAEATTAELALHRALAAAGTVRVNVDP